MRCVAVLLLTLTIGASASTPTYEKELKKLEQLSRAHKFDQADRLVETLLANSSDPQLMIAAEVLRQQRARVLIAEGDRLLVQGDKLAAQQRFAHAYTIDPQNEYARQRFNDASGSRTTKVQVQNLASEAELQPKAGLHDFEYRGDSRGLILAFAREFGLAAEFDPNFVTRQVRFTLKRVDFLTAEQAVAAVTNSFIVPLSPNQFLVSNDDAESRRRLQRMSLRTFVLPDVATPQDLIELVNVLRMMFDLRQIMPNQATSSVTVRAPGAALDAAERLLTDLSMGRPEVLIDVQVLQVSHSQSMATGVDLPLQFTAFNINTELRNLVNDPNIQSLIDQLAAGGQLTPQQAAALAAFLAAAQNSASPLLQGFATFGGGLTRTGVVIPPAKVQASYNASDVKLFQHVTMRAQHAKPATYRIGERYPVLTGTFSPLLNIPLPPGLVQQNNAQPLTPSFNYEDLGITFKATPNVAANGDIRMDFDLALRSLTGQSFNGVPSISNRQYVGSMSVREGETTVIAGSLNSTEQLSVRGLPFLSQIPGLKEVLSTNTRDKRDDQLLLLVSARRVREGHTGESPEIFLAPQGSTQ
jgi:general secretion pathway protein D